MALIMVGIGVVRAEIAWRYREDYCFKNAKHVQHERYT